MHTQPLFASLLVAGTMALWPQPATAQEACGERQTIVTRLSQEFGEVRRDVAPAGLLGFYELFASESTGTWSLLLSDMTGRSCVLAAGDDGAARKSSLSADGWPRTGAVRVR